MDDPKAVQSPSLIKKKKKKGNSFNEFCVGKSDKLELARPIMVDTQEGFWECFT